MKNNVQNCTALCRKKNFLITPNVDIKEALHFLLKEEGYLLGWCDGKEAVHSIHTFQPHLVIIDLCEFSTTDLVNTTIPKLKLTKKKILLISTSNNVKQLAEKHGLSEFLEMPFKTDAFLQKIKFLLR